MYGIMTCTEEFIISPKNLYILWMRTQKEEIFLGGLVTVKDFLTNEGQVIEVERRRRKKRKLNPDEDYVGRDVGGNYSSLWEEVDRLVGRL